MDHGNVVHPAGGGTTVIINQPTGVNSRQVIGRDWSTGLCGCCEDIPSCCCGTFCCCFLHCQVASDMGEFPCLYCCVPGATIALRTKWRTKESITGSICDDCMMVWCCEKFVLCQLAREVKKKKQGAI